MRCGCSLCRQYVLHVIGDADDSDDADEAVHVIGATPAWQPLMEVLSH